ncbi:receptor-like protein 7 [Miscanthus floridulus]|uniref:receptor-like protein 7 n=1 Tax=Miscanthus floridulus TaxID=154761 RepID=UPI00345B4934
MEQQTNSKMAPTKHRFPMLLLLLLCSYPAEAAAMINSTKAPCLPAQASSLLQLKGSFIVANARLSSWQAGTDCCHWEGIICNTGSGRVISLDLGGFNLMSHRLHPALFNLTSLRNLNLAFNDFTGVRFPASGFERLTDITHLNFSYSYFIGQIPSGISRLKNLVTLDFSDNGLYLKDPSFQTFMANMSNLRELFLDYVDLSSSGSTWSAVLGHSVPQLRILSLSQCGLSGSIHPSFSRLGELTTINFRYNYELYFQEPSFRTFMANMSNLRELRLDSVDLSSSGSTWSTALGHSVPQRRILSLSRCGLSGSIHRSFSRLRSLASINFGYNELSGKVPEYFSELSSLSSLDISGNHFEGQFPTEIFQLKSLTTLDLSENPMLFVRFTYFPAGNNLQNLNLVGTNFTYDTPLSFANLTSLQTLSLTTGTMAKELPTSIRFPSLNILGLEGPGLENPGSTTVQQIPSFIGNLTKLTSLTITGFNFSGPIPYQIGNLANLRELSIKGCDFSGFQIPSWIGNLTKLISLDISDNNYLSGPVPSTIGNLMQIKWLDLSRNNLTGNIPESLFALPALQYLYLDTNQLSGSLEDFPHPLYSGFSQIEEIDLSDNQLTGQIPESLFQLANLRFLYLHSNKLMGTIKLSSI